MAAVVVALDGTRVNTSDAATNWANLGGGGPAPAAEAQLRYQGSNTVNRKVTSTTARQGVQYDPAASAQDMRTVTGTKVLFFVKGYVSDFGDLNTTYGCEVRIGSGSSAYYHYNIAGSGANRAVFNTYPNQGGYILTGINPNVSAWREGTSGSPDLQNVDYWGFAAQFVTGGAKSENLALDAIDVGRGLLLTRGDGADADGVFQDFVDDDEGNTTNRWGVVFTKGGIIYAVGRLTIGESGTATVFTDAGVDTIVFPDGYVDAGDLGIACSIENASSVITLGGTTVIGRGSSTTVDTRPDFEVVGTSGTFDIDGTILVNHRNVTFTSVCDVVNADIECALLTQASANLSDSVIRCDAAASVACLQDPTFGTTTDLRDCEFVQAGSGHAIEIDTAGTYTLQGLIFTGFNASDNQDDSMLDITAGSGTVTLNITGGGTDPSYRTAGATVVINNNTQVTLSGLIDNTEVRVYDAGTGAVIDGIENTSGGTFAFSDAATNVVDIRIFHIDYQPADILNFTIPSNDSTIPVQQIFDRNYNNP